GTKRRQPYASLWPKVSRPASCPRPGCTGAEMSSSGGASRFRTGGPLLSAGDDSHAHTDDYRPDPPRQRDVFADQSPRHKRVQRVTEGRDRQHKTQIGPRQRGQIESEKYAEEEDAQPDKWGGEDLQANVEQLSRVEGVDLADGLHPFGQTGIAERLRANGDEQYDDGFHIADWDSGLRIAGQYRER